MKKLYLKTWDFNSYLILNEIRKEIEKNGGLLVQDFPHILKRQKIKIYNRSFLEAEREIQSTAKTAENNSKIEEWQKKYYSHYFEALQANYKPCRIVENTSYLHFYYNDFIYYIQLNDNPFFNHYIIKEKAEKKDNEYFTKYSYYMEDLTLPEFDVCAYLSNKDIKRISKELLKTILEHKESQKVTERIRVRNYYGNGYHSETIIKEKINKYKILEK